jgi:ABC-type multidrug transport system fused ATPase/permease subunit
LIDGVDTSTVGLEELRSRISILPQGMLRTNRALILR